MSQGQSLGHVRGTVPPTCPNGRPEPAARLSCRPKVRRFAVIALISAVTGEGIVGVGSSVSATSSAGRSRTVPCNEIIDGTRFPYVGGFERRLRYRLVLGAVSAPPAYLQAKPSPTGTRPWTYFSKKGLIVRAAREQPVFISVPRRWRTRAGIAWGYGGHGVFTRFELSAAQGPRIRATHTPAASTCGHPRRAFRCVSGSASGARSCGLASVADAREPCPRDCPSDVSFSARSVRLTE